MRFLIFNLAILAGLVYLLTQPAVAPGGTREERPGTFQRLGRTADAWVAKGTETWAAWLADDAVASVTAVPMPVPEPPIAADSMARRDNAPRDRITGDAPVAPPVLATERSRADDVAATERQAPRPPLAPGGETIGVDTRALVPPRPVRDTAPPPAIVPGVQMEGAARAEALRRLARDVETHFVVRSEP